MTQKYNRWTSLEDKVLEELVLKLGKGKWSAIARQMRKKCSVSKRTGKQCRQRWFNQLDQSNRHKGWNKQQDIQLLKIQAILGNRWIDISQHFPGRSDNHVKNRFYSLIKRGIRKMCKFANIKTTSISIYDLKPITISRVTFNGIHNRQPPNSQPLVEQGISLANFYPEDFNEIAKIIHVFIFDNGAQQSIDKDQVVNVIQKLIKLDFQLTGRSSFYDDHPQLPQEFSAKSNKDSNAFHSSSPNKRDFQELQEFSSEGRVDHTQSQENNFGIFSPRHHQKRISVSTQCNSEVLASAVDQSKTKNDDAALLLMNNINIQEQLMDQNQFFWTISFEDQQTDKIYEQSAELKIYSTPKYSYVDSLSIFMQ